MKEEIPHLPWFTRPRPLDDGQAVIENGTYEGAHIAVCEWHVAEYIINCVNNQRPATDPDALTRANSFADLKGEIAVRLSDNLSIALAKIAKLSDAMAPIWRIVNLYEGMDDERTAYVPLGMLRHIRRALEETA